MQVSIFMCQWKSCCVENCCLAQALDIRLDFLLRRHYMLCLSQCQSDSALLTKTYWSSRGTAGRNSRFKLFLLLILGAFSFVLYAILNSQAGYRCTLVPRLPFPVPRSPFPVPRSPFPVLVISQNYTQSGPSLQRWLYCREHLKYVWNVYCVVTNHRWDLRTTVGFLSTTEEIIFVLY